MKKNLILGSFLFIGLTILLLYMAGVFENKVDREPTAQLKVDVASLTLHEMRLMQVPVTRVFSATLVADQKVFISARLTARIAEILVDVGDSVKQGDVLIRLDSGDLTAKVKQSQQAVFSAQAQLNIARKEFQRLLPLYQQKLVSAAQYDQAASQLKAADANFKKAKAAVSEAQTTFGFSIITAPFDAVIEQRVVDQGDLATPGMHLLSLYQPDSLLLETNISESLLNKIELGSELSYQLSGSMQKQLASVVRVTPASNRSSRSVQVSLQPVSQQSLIPGGFAKVWVEVEQEPRLVVPEQALLKVGQLDYVDLYQDGKIQRKLLQLGEGGVVRKGLKEGDKVIIHSQ